MQKLWNWMSGKKMAIAGFVFLIHQTILPIWFGQEIPGWLDKAFLSLGAFFGYIGATHKAIKAMPKKHAG